MNPTEVTPCCRYFIYDTGEKIPIASLQYERLAVEIIYEDAPESTRHLVEELTECGCPIEEAITISETVFDRFDFRINYKIHQS